MMNDFANVFVAYLPFFMGFIFFCAVTAIYEIFADMRK